MLDLISTLKLCGDEPLTDKEAETMVTLMDKDKDGLIDIEGTFDDVKSIYR